MEERVRRKNSINSCNSIKSGISNNKIDAPNKTRVNLKNPNSLESLFSEKLFNVGQMTWTNLNNSLKKIEQNSMREFSFLKKIINIDNWEGRTVTTKSTDIDVSLIIKIVRIIFID